MDATKTTKANAEPLNLERFAGDRWDLPRCFIIHAGQAPGIKPVLRQIKAALAGNFHVDQDGGFGADQFNRGEALAALREASLVICIFDDLPPNVVFEYGYAKALNKPCLRFIRKGASATLFKYFLNEGQRGTPDQPLFDFDKHFTDARDLSLCAYDHAEPDWARKILTAEFARADARGRTLARWIIEVWAELLRENLGATGDFGKLVDYVLANAKNIELGKPLFTQPRRRQFGEWLRKGFDKPPSTRVPRVAKKDRELPHAVIEAVSDLPAEARLKLIRKFLRQKPHAGDRRLLFAEAYTVFNLAGEAGFKNLALNREAENLCRRFLRKWPETPGIHYLIGTLYGHLKRDKDAEASFKEALRLNEHDAETHSHYAAWLKEQNRLEEAEQHFKEALRFDPEHAEAYTHNAVVLERQDRLAEAHEYYQEALRLNPDDADLHYNYAVLAGRQNQPETAAHHYLEALRLNPAKVEAHYYYAILLGEQKKLEEAEQHYKLALKLKPDDAEMRNNFAVLLLGLDRLKEAGEQWKAALRANPDFAQGHYNYAILLARQGDAKKAIHHYRETLRLNPNNADAHNDLGSLLMERKELEQAEFHLAEAIRLRAAAEEAAAQAAAQQPVNLFNPGV